MLRMTFGLVAACALIAAGCGSSNDSSSAKPAAHKAPAKPKLLQVDDLRDCPPVKLCRGGVDTEAGTVFVTVDPAKIPDGWARVHPDDIDEYDLSVADIPAVLAFVQSDIDDSGYADRDRIEDTIDRALHWKQPTVLVWNGDKSPKSDTYLDELLDAFKPSCGEVDGGIIDPIADDGIGLEIICTKLQGQDVESTTHQYTGPAIEGQDTSPSISVGFNLPIDAEDDLVDETFSLEDAIRIDYPDALEDDND